MQRKVWTLFGLVAMLALVAAAAVAALTGAQPVAAQQTTPTPQTAGRHITVVGHGEASARPDTAIVQIGVETQAATAREALAQNNTQAKALQDRLTSLGVAARDMQTTGFGIYPVYNNDGRQVTGYRVTNSVTVKIRNLDQAGALLDQVVQAGANSIYGISFTVDNPQAQMNQAREAAVRDAKARADVLAKAGGATVGELLVISESIGVTPPPMPLAARAEVAQDSASVPLQAGEQIFSIDVQVTYALR